MQILPAHAMLNWPRIQLPGRGRRAADRQPSARTHVFLLAGQSNMAGWSPFDGGAGYPAGTLQVGRSGVSWSSNADGALVPAVVPLDHWEHNTNTDMSLALQFTIDYAAAHPGVTVVLVPAAMGGTGFGDNRWNPGDDLYADAVARVNALMTANPGFLFKGILWHQGERDMNAAIATPAAAYRAALDAMIAGMRADIVAADATTPFVLGQPLYSRYSAEPVFAEITNTPSTTAYCAVVSSEGLTDRGDNLHFNAASLRSLGARYATALGVARTDAPVAPGAVRSLAATPAETQVVLNWQVPADQGGAPVTSYLVEQSSDGGASWSAVTSTAERSVTVSGLSEGTAYVFRVSATTATGSGPAASVSTTTLVTTPTGPSPEAGALAHWLFGADNASMADLVSGQLVTGTPAAQASGYLTVAAGEAQGLDTGVLDTQEMCMIIVARKPAINTKAIICGALGHNDTDGLVSSAGLYWNGSSTTTLYFNNEPLNVGSEVTNIRIEAPDFGFLAYTFSTATNSWTAYQGAAGGAVTKTWTGRNWPPRDGVQSYGIGNLRFTRGTNPFTAGFDVAEVIIFDQPKTVAELDAIYARSQTRMSARGVALA